MEIIITTSTSPERIKYIPHIITNLLYNQTIKPTKFYLNLPHIFKRSGQTYNEDFLEALKNKFDRLQINRCEDLGPITKLYPTLNLINNPETIIIILDDDTLYPPFLIEELVKKLNEDDKKVVANSILQNNGTGIDIVEGFKGICFKRKTFKDDFNDYVLKTNNYIHCYKSDDYIISRYLTKRNVSFCRPNKLFVSRQFDYGFKEDALHKQDNITHIQRYNLCNKYLNDNHID